MQAEAGTGKTFVAGLIHTLSGNASQPFVEIDCAKLPHSEDERLNTDILFGRNGERAGILELLERGTLLLNNIHVLSSGDRTRIGHYLQTGLVLPNHGIISPNNLDSELPKPIPSSVRLILLRPKTRFTKYQCHHDQAINPSSTQVRYSRLCQLFPHSFL